MRSRYWWWSVKAGKRDIRFSSWLFTHISYRRSALQTALRLANLDVFLLLADFHMSPWLTQTRSHSGHQSSSRQQHCCTGIPKKVTIGYDGASTTSILPSSHSMVELLHIIPDVKVVLWMESASEEFCSLKGCPSSRPTIP